MAVQFVEERGNLGSFLGEGLRKGFERGNGKGFLETLMEGKERSRQEQKQKLIQDQENQAIKREYNLDLSGINDPKQRQEILSRALQGKYKAEENQSKSKKFADVIGNNSRNQPGAHASNDQGNFDLSNISDEKLAELSLSYPQETNALRQIVHGARQQKDKREKTDLEMLSSEKFSEGYQAIQSGDEKSFDKIIADPKTPLEIKNKLNAIKNANDVRKDVKARELRTRLNFVQNAYSKAIASEKNLFGNAGNKEKKEINERIGKLEKLRKRDMSRLAKDPESYGTLSIWGTGAADFLPEDEVSETQGLGSEDDFGEMEGQNNSMSAEGQSLNQQPAQKNQPVKQGQRIKFNPKDPQHVQYAQQVLQSVGGNRQKANEIIAQEFDL